MVSTTSCLVVVFFGVSLPEKLSGDSFALNRLRQTSDMRMRLEIVGILFQPANPVISRPFAAVEDVLLEFSCRCVVHTVCNDAFGVLCPVKGRFIGFSVHAIFVAHYLPKLQ